MTTSKERGHPARNFSDPDPHGQAALLLVESLIHGLIEKGVLTVGDALAIMTSATEVEEEIADAKTEADVTAQRSVHLLHRIFDSLEFDLARPVGTPRRNGAAAQRP